MATVNGVVSFADAIRFWLKLGFISFGGPAGQIAIMHQELVERRRWISEGRFLHALNYCMLLPGPEAQQLATYIGWLLHRTWGGLVAGLLFILPSFVILVILSWLYMSYGQVPAVAAFFFGMKPAVVAIVAFAAWRIGSRVLRNAVLAAIAVLAFVALFFFSIPFPLIVIAAALTGASARVLPRIDSRPRRWRRRRRVRVVPSLMITVRLHLTRSFPGDGWCACSPSVSCCGLPGWPRCSPSPARTARWRRWGAFFTKAALVTFGGAYAVLPYVNQAAVEQYHWLTAPQMIDGLALGETTPGPLIMVVTFVGFVGNWTQAAPASSPALAGLTGALVVTFFTFLPSFVFIFAGAPLVEATRGRRLFTAPLTAITAAVVGVIANLAAYFAFHVFWPKASRPDAGLAFAGHRRGRGARALLDARRRGSRDPRLRSRGPRREIDSMITT